LTPSNSVPTNSSFTRRRLKAKPPEKPFPALLSSGLALFFEFSEKVIDLLFRESLVTPGTLVNFVGELVIDQFIGKIDRVKAHGEIVDPGEIFVLATVTNEIVLHDLHLLPPQEAPCLPLIFLDCNPNEICRSRFHTSPLRGSHHADMASRP
jgi:hypothetical protein